MKFNSTSLRVSLVCAMAIGGSFLNLGAATWAEKSVSPVANPLFFEDPQIRTEIRPLFIHHQVDDDFIVGGADARVYAVQARYAVNDRLAIIATKDGYVEIDLDSGGELDGWAISPLDLSMP